MTYAATQSPAKLISIICPVYNEEAAVPLFYERLQRALRPLADRCEFELIFVNNRSVDSTLDTILRLRESDPATQVITLSRNFGYQASLQAGLSSAKGDAIIAIDVDCEDPPEMIPEFVAKWEEGYDIVYGMRLDRPEAWVMKKLRNLFYHVLRTTADMETVLYMAEFALISANVRDSLISSNNTFPFFRSEIGYAGFSRYGIRYKRHKRTVGTTHYNLFRMTAFAIGGIFTSSTFLLRAAAYLLPLLAAFNATLAGAAWRFGWKGTFEALLLADLLWIAFLLTTQGLYLARVYKNGMGRPVFIIDPRWTHLNRAVRGIDARGSDQQQR